MAGTAGRPFPLPEVDGRRDDSFEPIAIRDGWVVGRGNLRTATGGSIRALRYRIDTGQYEQVAGPPAMIPPEAVAATGSMSTGGRQPGITDATGAITLLPKDPDEWRNARYEVVTISDDGLTAAGRIHGGGHPGRALLWRCS